MSRAEFSRRATAGVSAVESKSVPHIRIKTLIVRRWRIIVTVLVFVGCDEIAGFRNSDRRHLQRRFGNNDSPGQSGELAIGRAFVEDIQFIVAWRDFQLKRAIPGGAGEPGRVEHQNDRTHRGMNITEEAYHARSGETHRPRSTWRIESHIEDLAAVAGKSAVEDRVEIG